MATIAVTLPKNLRTKLGEAGAQEFVAILNQINTAQLEENGALKWSHIMRNFSTSLHIPESYLATR